MKRKSLVSLCTAGLIMTSLGAGIVSPVTARAATQSLLKLGSKGSAVVTLQKKLNSLGYACGTANGVFGSKTLAAVKKFQAAKHLTVDGIVGSQTLAALNGSKPRSSSNSSSTTHSSSSGSITITATPTLQDGSSGTAVKALQAILNHLGFSCGTIDGAFGAKTLNAVKAFQKQKKLTTDGVVGLNTWNTLKKALGNPASSSTPSSRGSSLGSSPGSTSKSGGSSSGTSGSSGGSSSAGSGKSGSGSSSSTPPSSSTGPSGTTSSAPTYPNNILQSGSSGTAVTDIQNQLNKLGYNCGAADGQFGTKTTAAVQAFQKAKGLTVDGQVGAQTWDALFGTKTTTPPTATSSGAGGAFKNVDLRFPAPSDINTATVNHYLQSTGSSLTGLGESFLEAQNTYAVDATYLVAHAVEETGNGTSLIAQNKNNLFGYGAYDSNPGNDAGMFPSDDYAIRFEAWEVRFSYLTPGSYNYGGSPTLTGMNQHYATDPAWSSNIGTIMGEIAASVDSNVSNYKAFSTSNQAPAPSSGAEPLYYLNGASGVTLANTTYGGVPYYSSLGGGESDMFVGSLNNGSIGNGTALVQQYLNHVDNAGLTVDGEYGMNTVKAVKAFEKLNQLSQDGVWSASMWVKYIQSNNAYKAPVIPAGQTVQIDNIAQGMAGGLVTPWYHVKGYGWVESKQIQFSNVYRLTTLSTETASNTSIPVYASNGTTQIATLHAGDFVVAATSAASNGLYKIQFAAQTNGASFGGKATGTLLAGTVKSSTVRLTQQH